MHRAVAVDVGVDDRRNACVLKRARQIGDHHVGLFGPALGGNLAVAGVDADSDFAGELARCFTHQIGVFDRHGAKNYTGQPFVDPAFDGRHVADAAPQLSWHITLLKDRLNRCSVYRLACKCPVQIHQMQPFTTGFDEL